MILIINCGSTKTPDIAKNVSHLGYSFGMITYSELSVENLKPYRGIIISGAPILLTEIDYTDYLKSFAFILTIKIPVLGICFGHQIIGLLHGSMVGKCRPDRNWQTIRVLKSAKLFDKIKKQALFKEDHCECISVPSSFQLIAESDVCLNEGMQHQTKPLFGVQFHPEVSEDNGMMLFRNFLSLCK
jgi:GMP synthase (glutamine-hydrolysing)